MRMRIVMRNGALRSAGRARRLMFGPQEVPGLALLVLGTTSSLAPPDMMKIMIPEVFDHKEYRPKNAGN